MIDERLARAEYRLSERVARWSSAMGARIDPPPGIVGMRAGILPLAEPGEVSANGSCRMVRASDAWLAINLPRGDDPDLVPALLELASDGRCPWQALRDELPGRKARAVIAQATLLGMAVAQVGEAQPSPRQPQVGDVRSWDRAPKVVDLSALWAGPLCGALLAQAGCAVVKVETKQRPDTSAAAAPRIDALLNGRKTRWRIDEADANDQERLRDLLGAADLVITNARLRALPWLPAMLSPHCIWLALRAHQSDPFRIGYGDDCAAAGGLVTWQDGAPRFLGDAAADPLAGLACAATAFRALALRQAGRFDIALSSVAAEANHG